jgi:F0F1-type ATP synthase assembly protein I
MSMDPAEERDRERRFERRTGRRLTVGAIVGTMVGAMVGLIVGAVVFDPWGPGHWAMILALAILGGGIMMVQGGLAGLEQVDPGAEPSQREDPVRGPEGWTSPERDDRRPDRL